MQHAPVVAHAIPPDTAPRQAAAADDPDGPDRRIGKQRQQIGHERFVHHECILMQVDLVAGLGLPHSGIVAGTHRGSPPHGNVFRCHPLRQIQRFQIQLALAVPVFIIHTGYEGYTVRVKGRILCCRAPVWILCHPSFLFSAVPAASSRSYIARSSGRFAS